jgi:hypothetical protein
MNKLLAVLVLMSLFLTASCQTPQKRKGKSKKETTQKETTQKVIIGFNQNFSMMPNMNEEMYKNIQRLKPKMLRYPGGTVSHSWNWKDGVIETRTTKSKHPIAEIKTLVDYTNAEFVFVLDILNKTLADQIEMLTGIEKLGVKINYIELGNELYAQEGNYKKIFPTGKDYALKVNQWLPELKKKFPKAKVAALLLGRKVRPSNERLYNWNRQVVDNTKPDIDAFTYHIYIGEDKTYEEEKAEFTEVTQNAKTNNKPIWITEYGSNHDKSKASYFTELDGLADFVESFPNVVIALNHQIVGGTKNKLTEDGKDFVEEGQLFLKRVNKN